MCAFKTHCSKLVLAVATMGRCNVLHVDTNGKGMPANLGGGGGKGRKGREGKEAATPPNLPRSPVQVLLHVMQLVSQCESSLEQLG